MHSRRRVPWFLALVGAFFAQASLQAQGEKAANSKNASFTSVDGVNLRGRFYPAPQRNAPAVLLLHALNEDSSKKTWTGLAEHLQKSGYSVLRFDFRGHGQSTEVEPDTFWKYAHNQKLVKGAMAKKTNIEYKDMNPAYFPTLVNDIAAAKAFLEQSNDNGDCNAGSTILIGADTGATLGAIWLNSEWNRFRLDPPLMFGFPPEVAKRREGKDVIAGIWLSLTSKLGPQRQPIDMSKLLALSGKEGATPMIFFYSEEDAHAKSIAKTCVTALKGTKKADKDKYRYTDAVKIEAGKLSGAALLQKSLGVDDAIVTYLKEVVDSKGNQWGQRDFRKAQFVWRGVPGVVIPCLQDGNAIINAVQAKTTTEKTMVFDTYDKFIPR